MQGSVTSGHFLNERSRKKWISWLQTRRSIRKYASPIPHDELVKILSEAQQAPSWANMQASRCYVVETASLQNEFRESCLPGLNRSRLENASVIVTTFVKDLVAYRDGTAVDEVGNGWGAYDLGLHNAYLILAIRNAGYDSVILGLRDSAAIRSVLGIPENEQIMAVIAAGKRDEDPTNRPRKPLEDVVSFL